MYMYTGLELAGGWGGWTSPSSCLQTLIFKWKSVSYFNPSAKFQTFRHPTPNSFRSVPTLRVHLYHVYTCYAGNERDAGNRELLKDAGIDHVLNVTSNVPLHFINDVTMTYRRIPASDSGCQNLEQFFNTTVDFIGESPYLKNYFGLKFCVWHDTVIWHKSCWYM